MPVFLIATVTFCFSGCDTPDEDRQPESDDRQAPLVLSDFRDVDQAQGQWQHVTHAVDHQRQILLLQSALALRGIAGIGGDRFSGPDCRVYSGISASGLLTSSTRLVTAHHVVASRVDQEQIPVYFEATFTQQQELQDSFVQDADANGFPLVYFDRALPYPTKFTTPVENPLLANRLSQLGLNLSRTARRTLRGPWHFGVQDDDFPAVLTASGRLDVAVLEAQHRSLPFHPNVSPDDWRYLRTGSLPPLAPGVFFDYRPFRSLSYCPTELDEDYSCPEPLAHGEGLLPQSPRDPSGDPPTPLWLLHHNEYPEDRETNVRALRTNIVSNPFPYLIDGIPDASGVEKGVRWSDPYSGFVEVCTSDGLVPFEYGDQFDVTLDSFGGSSGGALFHPHRFVQGNGVRESSHRIYPHAVAVAISNAPPPSIYAEWGLPQADNLDHLNVMAAASEAVSRRSQYDQATEDEDDASKPTPIQPEGDGGPACIIYDDDRNCVQYKRTIVDNHAYPMPSALLPYRYPEGIDPDDVDADEALHEEVTSSENGTNRRWVGCAVSHSPFTEDEDGMRINAGLGVGFFGSLRYNPHNSEDVADDGSVVGYLRMICAPWSSVPFVSNWLFLQTIGTSYSNTSRDTALFPGRFGSLAEALVTVGEIRNQGDVATVRPLSMKTCPPNYFLRGVAFHSRKSPSGSERVLAGIRTLHCQRSNNPHDPSETIPDTIDVDLYGEDVNSCWHSIGEQCFSLGQQIGWSRPVQLPSCRDVSYPEDCHAFTRCPDGQLVDGFSYWRNAEGLITSFHISCIEEPG